MSNYSYYGIPQYNYPVYNNQNPGAIYNHNNLSRARDLRNDPLYRNNVYQQGVANDLRNKFEKGSDERHFLNLMVHSDEEYGHNGLVNPFYNPTGGYNVMQQVMMKEYADKLNGIYPHNNENESNIMEEVMAEFEAEGGW